MPLGGGLSLASAGVSLLGGIGKTIFGGKELRDTKKELSRLKKPEYEIESEYFQNERLGASLAQQGLTQQAKDYYTEEAGRGLGAGISGVLGAGGNANMISGLLDQYNRGIEQISVQDAEKQTANIQNYMQSTKDLAGQKTMQWAINEYQPYQNKLKELTQRRGAAYQNLFGGIGDIAGSLGAGAVAASNMGLGTNAGDSSYTPQESNLRSSSVQGTSNYGSPNVLGAMKNLIPE
jgi:hypothetical protein